MTQTQQERALEKGREVLRRRRQFGREVEAGEAKLSDMLACPWSEDEQFEGEWPPRWLENARLGLVLRWLPGVGPATVEKILEQVPKGRNGVMGTSVRTGS